jgi:hypothetical protein
VKRCSDTGTICAVEADCAAAASCSPDDDAGPIGQYVTIYGSNFGTTPGTVRFRNRTNDAFALADTSFPSYCPSDFWHNDYIIVKVPPTYNLLASPTPLAAVLHDLWIVRGTDGLPSNAVDFDVIAGQAGPSICSITPLARLSRSKASDSEQGLGKPSFMKGERSRLRFGQANSSPEPQPRHLACPLSRSPVLSRSID